MSRWFGKGLDTDKIYMPGVLRQLDELKAEVNLLKAKVDNLQKNDLMLAADPDNKWTNVKEVLQAVLFHLNLGVVVKPPSSETVVVRKYGHDPS